MSPPKGKGSKGPSPPKEKKSPKESVKYTYASWIRYFFGDFPNGDLFEAGPDHPQPLEQAAFDAFWLSRAGFQGVLANLRGWTRFIWNLHFLLEITKVNGGGLLSIWLGSTTLPLELDPLPLHEAMKRLKASVIFYESVKSASPPHKILIMYKDPYYVTSIAFDFEKSVHDVSKALSKKRKFASSQKEKVNVLRNMFEPSIKRFPMKTPPVGKFLFS
ncbi:PMD domain-containing protein [Sesbania bispinosa]|nr:PMD domain-containing protein [Sesbania bispinosa]